MNTLKSWTLVAIMALAANVASAAPGGKFSTAHSNKDDALTKAEACDGKMRRICKNFEAMDSNRDGLVTRDEAKGFRDAKRVAKSLPPKTYSISISLI